MNNNDEDPFDCFGESEDDSSTDDSLSKNNNLFEDSVATAEAEAERGQRLLNEHEYRKKNYEHEHTPLIQKNDFEVFDSNPNNNDKNNDNDNNDDNINIRGKGVRVLRSYQEGDEIMREGAAIRVPGKIFTASTQEEADMIFANNIRIEFHKLSKLTATAYMNLSSCRSTNENDDNSNNSKNNDTITGIYETNSFQLGDEINSGLFLTISRINHSCRPNVNHIWRPDLQKTLIQATRTIHAGEEIFTSYGPSECLSTFDRRTYLENKYSFVCDCTMCQEGNEYGGDDRMIELNTIFDELSLFNVDESSNSNGSGNDDDKDGNESESDKAIRSVDRGLLLLQKQGLGSGAFVRSFLRSGYQISLNATTKTSTSTIGTTGTTSNEYENEKNQNLARTYLERELIAVQNSEGIGSYRGIDIERTLKWYHGGDTK